MVRRIGDGESLHFGPKVASQYQLFAVLKVYTRGFSIFGRDLHDMITDLESEVGTYRLTAPFPVDGRIGNG